VEPFEAVYVGDSLAKDVGMAKAAGVPGVWARYGRDYDDALWDLLVQITHWTDEDVRREERIREAYGDVEPDATIDAFSEILKVGPALTRHAREAA
jgi:phosphoglycolate phosphatase